jgi:hypothetical protein
VAPQPISKSIALALAVAQLTACATFINTPWQKVEIESTPPGAEVIIEPGDHRLTTPGEVRLRRGTSYLATFELEGHRPVAEQMNPQISAWAWGGLVLSAITVAGLVVMAVDLATGSAYHLEPDPVRVELDPDTL